MAKRIYTLDGSKPKFLKEIVSEVVENYAKAHKTADANAISTYFCNTFAGIGVPHIVETAAQYHTRNGQKSQARTVTEVTIPNGQKVYVSTQWRAGSPDDNFIKFKDIVNRLKLGKIV